MKQFRYDISFLRAISVIFVLLYHFKFKWFQGGFIGVDIFFVISGFLMTKITLEGFTKNKFSLGEFYKRRVIRIIPPLLFLIIVFAGVVYFILPTQFVNYCKSAFSSSLFFSNIYYFINSSYFDASSQFNFLLHTWSLSVEWQFYMIYPLILLVFRKLYIKNPRVFKLIFIGVILLSIGVMLLHNLFNSSYSFYIFYPRSWEMMAGGLAFLYQNKSKQFSIITKGVIFSTSTIILFLCIFKINEHSYAWPSLLTILPVIATTAIIFINLDLKIFRNKIINYIGDISYSLYLWHWPLYVISLYYALNIRLRHKLIFILLSIICAIFSYHFIEKRNYSKKYLAIISLSIIVFSISFATTKIDTNYIFINKKIANLAYYANSYKDSDAIKKQYNFPEKHFRDNQKYSEFDKSFLKIDVTKKNVVLLGDSHAGMFAKSFEKFAQQSNFNLIQISADATFPMYNSVTPFNECKLYFNYIFSEFFPENYKNIDYVIINSSYDSYSENDLSKKINWTENYFKKLNIKTIYIGQNEAYNIDFPTAYYLGKTDYYKRKLEIDVTLEKLLKEKYINLNSYKIEQLSKDGIPYTYDHGHLTEFGTEQYLEKIKNKLTKPLN